MAHAKARPSTEERIVFPDKLWDRLIALDQQARAAVNNRDTEAAVALLALGYNLDDKDWTYSLDYATRTVTKKRVEKQQP